MDKSEEDYETFSNQMSWWCLPYAINTLPKLISDYKAHGLPHLVVIDTDGKVITMDGVQSIREDPVGNKFPWRRNRIVDILPKQYIKRTAGNDVLYPFSYLDGKYLMLYFGAKSDALTKEWNPWLMKAYGILKDKRGDDFEVCFRLVYYFICLYYLFPISSLASFHAFKIANLYQWRCVVSWF
jgi:nucleoredoxin